MKRGEAKLVKKLSALKQVKKEGHDTVDAIVKLGISKTAVYAELRKRLGCNEGNEHFAKCYTIREVQKRCAILEGMRVEQRDRNDKRNEARREAYRAKKGLIPEAIAQAHQNKRSKDVLPLHEQRAIHAEMRERRATEEAWQGKLIRQSEDRRRAAEMLAWTVTIGAMAAIGYGIGYGLGWVVSLLMGA